MVRQDIEFNAEGTVLRGWLYRPDGKDDRAVPAVVMAHGFSAVKEMYLDDFAEVFASGGLGVVVFDHRNFGESDGEPRQEIDPWAQVRDYRHAITWLRDQPAIDAERIGVWGTSYSGGHALVVGAIDRRVKAVVSQVPLVDGYRSAQRLVRADVFSGQRVRSLDRDRRERFAGRPPAMVPLVTGDARGAAMPTAEAARFFEDAAARGPRWRNEVTLRSAEMLTEYLPGAYIDRVSPTPLLMIVSAADDLAPTDLALDAYQRALEPKRLVLVAGGHFDVYRGAGFHLAATAARDWFLEYLRQAT